MLDGPEIAVGTGFPNTSSASFLKATTSSCSSGNQWGWPALEPFRLYLKAATRIALQHRQLPQADELVARRKLGVSRTSRYTRHRSVTNEKLSDRPLYGSP